MSQETKLIPQEYLPVSRPVARARPGDDLTTRALTPMFFVVAGLVEARDRLSAQFEGSIQRFELEAEAHPGTAGFDRPVHGAHPLEASLCWLITAAALVWVVLGIIAL